MNKKSQFGVKIFVLFLALSVISSACTKKGQEEMETQKDYPIKPVAFTDVKISDSFWLLRMETNRNVTIPFAFKKSEETGRINNFAIAGGLIPGEFIGRRYNDSDVFKIMEGAAYSLSLHYDPELDKYIDDLIVKIAGAQEDDGYLFTTRTIDPENPAPSAGKERWSNLGDSHELYNVGHLYEAAVAHYLATGKRSFLDIALKNADFIASVFGEGGRQGFPSHQEIEIGLVKLYRLTGDEKYLDLAKFFLDQRGRIELGKMYEKTSDFSISDQERYIQAHKPVVEQEEAVGHAVRAAYMYSGMADVAALTGDTAYIEAIDRIWENVVSRKLYVTGGIGSRHEGEAFGDDYELPNAEAYSETCAAIGNVFWNHRLFLLHGDAKYLDILERTLYNGLISGISLSGDLFFYPNPLEADGEFAFNKGATTRKAWFDCACCPVNLARFLPSFSGYVYSYNEDILYINLFVESSGTVKTESNSIKLDQKTRYPWEGRIRITVEPELEEEFAIYVRIPGWAQNKPVPSDLYTFVRASDEQITLKINSKTWKLDMEKGFTRIQRRWKKGDIIEIDFPMPVRRVKTHEKVIDNQGKVAIQRGPLVYCFEGIDNEDEVLSKSLPDDWSFEVDFHPDLLGGISVITAKPIGYDINMVAVPYYVWSHRGAGEMAVWLTAK